MQFSQPWPGLARTILLAERCSCGEVELECRKLTEIDYFFVIITAEEVEIRASIHTHTLVKT